MMPISNPSCRRVHGERARQLGRAVHAKDALV